MLQLADVAGPGLAFEPGEGAAGDPEQRALVGRGGAGEEVGGEQGDVAPPLGQRRQADGDQVEPVEEVLAEGAGGHGGAQVAVGGGDHPHVEAAGRAGPEDLEGAVLQDAQELHLAAQIELADLVQQDGAAVGERRSGPRGRGGRR